MHATATDIQLVLVHAMSSGTEEHMLRYGSACQQRMNTVSVTLPCSQVGIHSADDLYDLISVILNQDPDPLRQ